MKWVYILIIAISSAQLFSQSDTTDIYDPEADAMQDIEAAILSAKEMDKHVFIQIGGNWCRWCKYFNNTVEEDEELKEIFDEYYIGVKVNYDQRVKNADVLKMLGYPQRFGFPVFVILDSNGNRLHTQDAGLLEKGLKYDKKKISVFLRYWSKLALDPETYKD